jgi:hypothetical protein
LEILFGVFGRQIISMNIPLRKEEGSYILAPLEWEQNYAYLCKGVNQHNFLPLLRHRLAQVSIISLALL